MPGVRKSLMLLALAGVSAGAAHAATVPIACATAKAFVKLPARPVWFPSPQPAGTLVADADALPVFVHGIEWRSGSRYVWLVREPHGANLGDTTAEVVGRPYLANLGRRIEVIRLSADARLFAQWPTSGRYPDLTAAVAKGATPAQFIAFLRSLRRIAWPGRCADRT